MREILRYYLEIRDLKDLKKVNAPNKDVAFQLVKKPDFIKNSRLSSNHVQLIILE